MNTQYLSGEAQVFLKMFSGMHLPLHDECQSHIENEGTIAGRDQKSRKEFIGVAGGQGCALRNEFECTFLPTCGPN